jgi:ADP-ribose pyrophosphatase
MKDVVGYELDSETLIGDETAFFRIRRLRLRNRRDDGSLSAPYVCEFVERPKGLDAVVVAIFARVDGRVRVLVREALRPALTFGRDHASQVVPDEKSYLGFPEVVAGIVERSDHGEEGIRQRAVAEVAEEAGYEVRPESILFLGSGTFATPGSMAEKYWLLGVEIDDIDARGTPLGDGSPMEEGGRITWLELQEAIAACVAGRIEDAKTELVFRRLADVLRAAPP